MKSVTITSSKHTYTHITVIVIVIAFKNTTEIRPRKCKGYEKKSMVLAYHYTRIDKIEKKITKISIKMITSIMEIFKEKFFTIHIIIHNVVKKKNRIGIFLIALMMAAIASSSSSSSWP